MQLLAQLYTPSELCYTPSGQLFAGALLAVDPCKMVCQYSNVFCLHIASFLLQGTQKLTLLGVFT